MRTYRFFYGLFMVVICQTSFGQITTYNVNQKQLLLKQAIQMLKKTKAALQVNFNAQTDKDEKKSWEQIMGNLTKQQVVFANDLNPVGVLTEGSKMLPIKEYLDNVQTRYQSTGGLSFNINFDDAKVLYKNQTDLCLYVRKYMQGTWHLNGYESQELIRNYELCRVVLRLENEHPESLKIAYIDNDLTEIDAATTIPTLSTTLADRTMEDMIEKIVNDLSEKLPKSETKQINIQKVAYQGKGIINTFSHLFTGELKSMLTCVHRNLEVTLPVRSLYRVLTLSSTYAVTGNELEVVVTLTDSLNKSLVHSSYKMLIDKKSQWATDLVPSNEQVTNTTILTNVLKETPDNYDIKKLQFEVRTNKGSVPQSFEEGEHLTLFAIANRPCRVRILYRDATGSLFFLNNQDFQLTADQINVPQKLPEEFACSAPFGVEALIGFATTGAFAPLKTEKRGPLTYLLESLEHIKDKSVGSQTIERMVQITTYPKK